MDGVLYVIDKLGQSLAVAEQQVAILTQRNAELQDRLDVFEATAEDPTPPGT